MKKSKILLAALALCVSAFTFTSAAMAEETETPEVKSTFMIEGMEVENVTDLVVKEGIIETVKDGDAEISNVILTDEEGKEHTFEKVDVEDWKDLKFVVDYEMYYIQYVDKTGKSREAEEDVEEIIWDEPVTMYAKGSVNVRKEPMNGAEAIYYASLGEEYQVLGIAPGWFKIQVNDDLVGYIYHKYITEDKAVVDELIAAAEAEAAAAAAYDAQSSSSNSSKKGSNSKKQQKQPQKKPSKEPGNNGCLDNGLMN